MVQFLLVLVRFLRSIGRSIKDPDFQALLFLVTITLASGTIFYWRTEGWGLLDAFYFSVITLTTVGYGDLSPSTPASKIFTVFYIFVGVGIILGFVNAIAERSLTRDEAGNKHGRKKEETGSEGPPPDGR